MLYEAANQTKQVGCVVGKRGRMMKFFYLQVFSKFRILLDHEKRRQKQYFRYSYDQYSLYSLFFVAKKKSREIKPKCCSRAAVIFVCAMALRGSVSHPLF